MVHLAMGAASDGSVSTKDSTTYDSPRKRREIRRHLKRFQISNNDSSVADDSYTVGSQSTISSMPRSSKPTKSKKKESESSLGSESLVSTKPSISPRQQQIVQMLRARSSSRLTPLTAHPNFRAARSFSTSARPPVYPTTNSKAKGVDNKILELQRNGGSAESSITSKNQTDSTSPSGLKRQLSPLKSSLKPTSSIPLPKIESTTPTVFHVRLSIGYMTGVKLEKVAKWTRNTNHNLVVGFVELASSGKYTALSQPLLPNVGQEKSRTVKILWANPTAGKEASKSRRRLHFSLQIDRQRGSAADDEDDDSFRSRESYMPEVVRLLVGLKCGDERLPLGIAKFVVNGRETVEQKMDLAVQPEPGLGAPNKTKRGVFGKKHRSTFAHGDHAYKIAPNAKLRVKADIRTGLPGQDGAAVWASGKDDSSYVTNWTYDASTANQSSPHVNDPKGTHMMTRSPSQIDFGAHNLRSEYWIDPENPDRLRKNGKSIGSEQHDASTGYFKRAHQAPVQFVSLRSPTDLMSMMSGLSAPESGCDGFWFSKSCMPFLCDAPEIPKGNRNRMAKSFSFESSDRSGMRDMLPNSKSVSTASSTGDSSNDVGKDSKGTRIQVNSDLHPQSSGIIDPRVTADDEVETLDVTVETYNDLKHAQQTLMRYASKVGVDMVDLLDGKHSFRRR